MYEFIDVNEMPSQWLPAEAMQINGEYIEELVDGYRTLHVSGREVMTQSLTAIDIGKRSGQYYQSRRYPERSIVVTFQIIAGSNAAYREAFVELNRILDCENAQLIFDDEPDKFFIGTPSEVGEIEPGRNSVTGSITFVCHDPFKYSVTEYEVSPTADDGSTFVVNYHGTQKAYPIFETSFYPEDEDDAALTGNGDCGFVAFMNEREKVLQFGDPDETQGEDYPAAQTLMNHDIKDARISIPKVGWTYNTGRVSDPSTITVAGGPTVGEYGTYKRMCANSYGSGVKMHGPFWTRTVPADKAGVPEATNWRFTVRNRFAISNSAAGQKQLGGFQVLLVNVSGSTRTIVAGFTIYKTASGSKANLHTYHLGSAYQIFKDQDVSYRGKKWGFAVDKDNKDIGILTSTIQAKDGIYTFDLAGKKLTVTGTSLPVHEITIGFMQYGTKPAMGHNYCLGYKFIKDNCDTWENIPNKFSAQDILTVDCAEGAVVLNNLDTPELGALGNEWEEFCLEPGTNQIGTAYSSWVDDEYRPTFTMKYREVFL